MRSSFTLMALALVFVTVTALPAKSQVPDDRREIDIDKALLDPTPGATAIGAAAIEMVKGGKAERTSLSAGGTASTAPQAATGGGKDDDPFLAEIQRGPHQPTLTVPSSGKAGTVDWMNETYAARPIAKTAVINKPSPSLTPSPAFKVRQPSP